MGAEAVEVGTNVVVLSKIFIVVSLGGIGCDEDNKEYSVEFEIILVVVVSS